MPVRETLPSAVASVEHGWQAVACAGCGVPFAHVVSFDAGLLVVPLYCAECSAWRELRCTRCRRVLYCDGCRARDEAAMSPAPESQPAAIARPEAIAAADSEVDAW